MVNKDGKTVVTDQRSVPGSRRQRRLEFGAGLRRDSGQPAGRNVLADDGCDFHPYSQAAAGRRRRDLEALKFFAWAYAKGGKMAEELDYVPMPDKVVSEIEAMWAKSIMEPVASRCTLPRIDASRYRAKAPCGSAWLFFHRLARTDFLCGGR